MGKIIKHPAINNTGYSIESITLAMEIADYIIDITEECQILSEEELRMYKEKLADLKLELEKMGSYVEQQPANVETGMSKKIYYKLRSVKSRLGRIGDLELSRRDMTEEDWIKILQKY